LKEHQQLPAITVRDHSLKNAFHITYPPICQFTEGWNPNSVSTQLSSDSVALWNFTEKSGVKDRTCISA